MQDNANKYASQDRGSKNDYEKYLAAMDQVVVEKVASASVFFDPAPGHTLVDIGMASGTSTNILAHLFPQLNIIGVDINPTMVGIAAQTYQLPNLEFRIDDGEKLSTFEEKSVNGFFNCSSIHHITSFNGYEPYRAYSTLKRQAELLQTGGIIVVRDFVKPPEMEVILKISDLPNASKPSDAELLIIFSKTARSLSLPKERGFPIKEIQTAGKGMRLFRLFYADAVEFIRRKDYYENWEIELQEEYGYFTQKEFEEVFAAHGMRVMASFPVYNPWIVRNRYRDQFSIYDKNMKDIGFPPTNYLIAGEKVGNKGTSICTVRHLPETEKPFLKFSSYQHIKTKQIFDVVLRPTTVVDVIPYYMDNDKIEIVAKHGYPRPIANVETDSDIIDQKHYSGYITEGLAASYHQTVEQILCDRVNLQPEDIAETEESLAFFTSPGGIDEKVESVFVRLKRSPEKELSANKNFSGFSDAGSIRKYDAIQLLKTAQTGALVEARLELNIYNLLRKLSVAFPSWLGEKIVIEEMSLPTITSLNDLLSRTEQLFTPSINTADYLQKYRAKFAESGVPDSTNILEFVTPQHMSINTLITLPVIRCNGEVYVGLESRNLPVPQLHTGNSFIPVAPACRLPKTVTTYSHLENFIQTLKFGETSVKHFYKLGEKFFPSIGVTPEQAYPYIVTLTEANEGLQWVSLKELYHHLEQLNDGHLLISIVRLVHAIGVDF
jgi:hypothetical protein